MRLLQVFVPDDRLEAVVDVLEDEEVDFVRQRVQADGENGWLVECPVPTDAIGHLLERLSETGIDRERYTVVAGVESAMTPRSEELMERYATDFDPLTEHELRSKARDMSRDPTTFLSMILLSAVIAVAGLLVGSPAVVVGSMVIAPIVGPVLTATVGAATEDGRMLFESLWLQGAGLAVAVGGATAFCYALLAAGFVPGSLDVASIDLIALRVAPSVSTLVIGLAAGAAGAFGLTTKGPTSLIGVMIAAALIPAAATVGIAIAWGEYRIAVGSLLLLVLTMILINAGSLAVLALFYRPEGPAWLVPSPTSVRGIAVLATAVALVVLVGIVGVASYQQVAFERTVNQEVEATLGEAADADVEPVAIRIQYGGVGPFGDPETVTVTASRTAGGEPPQVAGALDDNIAAATGHDVTVRIRFEEYQRSDDGGPDAASVGGDRVLGPGVL